MKIGDATHDQLMIQMPNLVNCSIHPKEKAMYICMTPTCPKYEALRLYCSMCNEKIAHDHVS